MQINNAGGEMAFGAVQIGLQCEYGKTSIWFRFHGSDELDEVSGDNNAEIEEHGTLSGEIRFDNGDETSFTANHDELPQPARGSRPTAPAAELAGR